MAPTDERGKAEEHSNREREDQGGRSERRPWYFRLPAHLPIRFQVLNAQREPLGAESLAGVTHDLGEQGLGFFAARLPEEVLAVLRESANDHLAIVIHYRLLGRDIQLPGSVSWVHPVPDRNAATIGVNFVHHEPADVLEMLRFSETLARRRQVLRAATAILVALAALIAVGVWTLR